MGEGKEHRVRGERSKWVVVTKYKDLASYNTLKIKELTSKN
jgi:hypothetical protein